MVIDYSACGGFAMGASNLALLSVALLFTHRGIALPQQPPLSPVAGSAAGSDNAVATAGKLVLLFPTGRDSLDDQNLTLLDQASRLYREGQPVLMIVSGSADSAGDPTQNLLLSQRRANAVARGLLARGIPAERTQILAKGETSPTVDAPKGAPEPQNRRVEISWR